MQINMTRAKSIPASLAAIQLDQPKFIRRELHFYLYIFHDLIIGYIFSDRNFDCLNIMLKSITIPNNEKMKLDSVIHHQIFLENSIYDSIFHILKSWIFK